jgi:hypothetical protein
MTNTSYSGGAEGAGAPWAGESGFGPYSEGAKIFPAEKSAGIVGDIVPHPGGSRWRKRYLANFFDDAVLYLLRPRALSGALLDPSPQSHPTGDGAELIVTPDLRPRLVCACGAEAEKLRAGGIGPGDFITLMFRPFPRGGLTLRADWESLMLSAGPDFRRSLGEGLRGRRGGPPPAKGPGVFGAGEGAERAAMTEAGLGG